MSQGGKIKKRWVALGVLLALILIGFLVASNWAAIGTSLANPMRRLIGADNVAELEKKLFEIQDTISNWSYQVGLSEPETPWEAPQPASQSISAASGNELAPTPTRIPATSTPLPAMDQAEQPADSNPAATETPQPSPTPLPTAAIWMLPDLKPFGELPGEGVWQPYIYNPQGEVVGLRTFLQPDPERPYALVAVAALDLNKTRLHYVLGLKEPAKPGGPHGWGLIPDADRQPGKLLAAFNGGFIYEHGGYGAMADGLETLAAKHGLATIVIFKDGKVRIGKWGEDITWSRDYESWRQNGLIIIDDGEINPEVYSETYEWGANIDGSVITIRSSLGLDQDNRILYYFAGPSLSMPALTDGMAAAGVHNGMLLDINPTHAHFTAMRISGENLVAESLYPEIMDLWVDRYLQPWDQDFFYLTPKE